MQRFNEHPDEDPSILLGDSQLQLKRLDDSWELEGITRYDIAGMPHLQVIRFQDHTPEALEDSLRIVKEDFIQMPHVQLPEYRVLQASDLQAAATEQSAYVVWSLPTGIDVLEALDRDPDNAWAELVGYFVDSWKSNTPYLEESADYNNLVVLESTPTRAGTQDANAVLALKQLAQLPRFMDEEDYCRVLADNIVGGLLHIEHAIGHKMIAAREAILEDGLAYLPHEGKYADRTRALVTSLLDPHSQHDINDLPDFYSNIDV